jgi:hypothetical protein
VGDVRPGPRPSRLRLTLNPVKRTVDGVFKIFGAFSGLTLAATYLLAWAGIRVFDADTSIRHLGYLVIAEFVQLMLGLPLVFFLVGPLRNGIRSRRLFFACTGTLALVLVIMGAGLSVSAGAAWPMVGVVLLLAGKAALYVRPPETELESRRILADTVVRASVLFFLLLPCALIPFPAWKAPAAMEEFGDVRPAGLLVLGASYFGLFGLFGHRLEGMVSDEPEAGPAPPERESPID